MIHIRENQELAIWKDWHENGKPYFVLAKTDKDKPHLGFREKDFTLQRDAIAHAEKHYPNVTLWIEKSDCYKVRHQGVIA